MADKIEADFGLKNVVVRAGKEDYQNLLKKRLHNLLHGIGLQHIKFWALTKAESALKKVLFEISNLEKAISSRDKDELKRGQFLRDYQGGFYQSLKRNWIAWRVNKELPIWHLFFEYGRKVEERNFKAKQLIQDTFNSRLHKALGNKRKEFVHFLKALRKP